MPLTQATIWIKLFLGALCWLHISASLTLNLSVNHVLKSLTLISVGEQFGDLSLKVCHLCACPDAGHPMSSVEGGILAPSHNTQLHCWHSAWCLITSAFGSNSYAKKEIGTFTPDCLPRVVHSSKSLLFMSHFGKLKNTDPVLT